MEKENMPETKTKTKVSVGVTVAVAVISIVGLGLIGYAAGMFPVKPPRPDLIVSVIESSDPVSVEDSLTYTVTVSNAGGALAKSVETTLTLPTELEYSSTTVTSGTLTCTLGGTNILCVGDLARRTSATFEVLVDVAANATECNGTSMINVDAVVDSRGRISEINEVNNTDSESLSINGPTSCSDLSMTITEAADPVPSGDDQTYTIVVTNSGPADTGEFSYSLTLSEPGGSAVDYLEIDTTGSTSDCALEAGVTYVCTDDLAAGATSTITAVVSGLGSQTPACGETVDYELRGELDFVQEISEADEANNEVTETTTFNGPTSCSDLSMTITEDADPVASGDDLQYAIVVTNNGLAETGEFSYSFTLSNVGGAAVDYLELDTTGSTSDCTLEAGVTYVCTDNLAAGTSSSLIGIVSDLGSQTPACGETVDFEFRGELDFNAEIDETDEANNEVSETTTFEGAVCP